MPRSPQASRRAPCHRRYTIHVSRHALCVEAGMIPAVVRRIRAGAATPGLLFRAAALAFRRAAGRRMSTHGRISSYSPTSARTKLRAATLRHPPPCTSSIQGKLARTLLLRPPWPDCVMNQNLSQRLWKIARAGCTWVRLAPSYGHAKRFRIAE